jgi:hypothetical protein
MSETNGTFQVVKAKAMVVRSGWGDGQEMVS